MIGGLSHPVHGDKKDVYMSCFKVNGGMSWGACILCSGGGHC